MAKLMYEFKNLRITEEGNLAADEMIDYTGQPITMGPEYVWMHPCTEQETAILNPGKEVFADHSRGPRVKKIDFEKKTTTFG